MEVNSGDVAENMARMLAEVGLAPDDKCCMSHRTKDALSNTATNVDSNSKFFGIEVVVFPWMDDEIWVLPKETVDMLRSMTDTHGDAAAEALFKALKSRMKRSQEVR